jgi:chromosome segregation ATPase
MNVFSEKFLKTEEHPLLYKLFGDIIENQDIQLKAISELSESNKKLASQIEEIGKSESKLQNDLKEMIRNEQTLKFTIENLNNNLTFERAERENTMKSLKHSNEELDKDTYLLKEKLTNLTQKCDVFKIENQELIEKYTLKCKELSAEREKLEAVLREKNFLTSQINETDK